MNNAAIDALVNEVVERWPEWEVEAGMDGQREQSSVAYTDTLRFRLRETIARHLNPPPAPVARLGVVRPAPPSPPPFDGTYEVAGDRVAVFGREGREGRPAGSSAE